MTVTIKIDGLADLDKALFELGSPSTARRVGQRALMQAAAPMVAAIAGYAPKDVGNLAESVKAQPSSRNRRKDLAEVVIGIDQSVQPPVMRERKRGKGTYRDPGVFGVAVVQEFGTSKMAANPFFRPGFDATAEQAIRITAQALRPEIEKSAARLAKRRAKAAGN